MSGAQDDKRESVDFPTLLGMMRHDGAAVTDAATFLKKRFKLHSALVSLFFVL